MTEYKELERFIPLNTPELIDLVCDDGELGPEDKKRFRQFANRLEYIFHQMAQSREEELEESYFPFDPDTDLMSTRNYSHSELREMESIFLKDVRRLLEEANFTRISEEEIDLALKEDTDLSVKVKVDMDQLDEIILYKRGEMTKEVLVPRKIRYLSHSLGKRLKKKVKIDFYRRVAMIVKFKPGLRGGRKTLMDSMEEGKIYLKLFKDVPKKDLEMVYPNSKVRMHIVDKLKIIVPVLIGLGAGGADLYNLITGRATHFLTIVILIALSGYIIKSYISYKNAILKYIKMLSAGLYFKNLANGASFIQYLSNEAEEEETKEVLLAYYFLLREKEGLTARELDRVVEGWFKDLDIEIDWDVEDALRKVKGLGLAEMGDGERWRAVGLEEGQGCLRRRWEELL